MISTALPNLSTAVTTVVILVLPYLLLWPWKICAMSTISCPNLYGLLNLMKLTQDRNYKVDDRNYVFDRYLTSANSTASLIKNLDYNLGQIIAIWGR